MKFVILATLLAVAAARPEKYRRYGAPSEEVEEEKSDPIEILRDERTQNDDGSYTFDFETENGIKVSEKGSRLDIDGNPIGSQGSISFTLPNGELFELSFIADDGGFQPQSSHIPVAPEFPHPIPDFVLEQIEKAEREDAEAAALEAEESKPSRGYSYN